MCPNEQTFSQSTAAYRKKLRSAETLFSIAALADTGFAQTLKPQRDLASDVLGCIGNNIGPATGRLHKLNGPHGKSNFYRYISKASNEYL